MSHSIRNSGQGAQPYPLHAFHLSIKNAIDEVQRNVQAPDALVAMSFLTTISVACQGLADVRLPTGQIRPLSLNIMGIADSGERKSTLDSLVAEPIYAHDEARAQQHEIDMARHRHEYRYWQSVDTGIRRRVTRAVRNGEATDGLRVQMEDHAKREPVLPRLRRFMRHNTTERALMEALVGDGESIGLMTDEGEIILHGGAMNVAGYRNKNWDGARIISFDRMVSGSIVARNPRVTISMLVQKPVLDAYLEKKGNLMRGSGHWARYLVGWPASTQGHRYIWQAVSTWNTLKVFHQRVSELLALYDTAVLSGRISRVVIEFSEEATARWVDLVNQVEGMIQPWGWLHDVPDFASKAAEIIGRLAALLHFFSGQDGKISLDTLERGMTIMEWHLGEAKRIFSPEASLPQVALDIQTLGGYLQTNFWSRGMRMVPKNDVLRHGPVRPVSRLDAALHQLETGGQVHITADNKRRRYIAVGPKPCGL